LLLNFTAHIALKQFIVFHFYNNLYKKNPQTNLSKLESK